MDPTSPATTDDVEEIARRSLTAPGPDDQRVGLEVEHLVMRVTRDGQLRGRAPLALTAAALHRSPRLTAEAPDGTRPPAWRTGDGVRVVPEPGGQIEVAGPPAATVRGALDQVAAATTAVAESLAAEGMVLASAGLDPWTPPGAVRQQLDAPRYPAMHAYLARRSPHGHTMMTSSASLQVNLDLGDLSTAAERWTTALLIAPLTVATFASSPVHGAVSGRAVAWQWLDPTRTGVPSRFTAGEEDPTAVLREAALDADVLLVVRGGGAVPGRPGRTLRRWIADGDDLHGPPTVADVATHMTTLFHEVRARGWLEIRGVDALPARWRAVPVVLLAGLLHDPRSRALARRVMEPHRHRLPELLRRAAHLGLADGELCAMAVEVWTEAVHGAGRLGPDVVDPADVRRAEVFIDRFTLRGRTPSDELRERLARSATAALDWAREPTGTPALC